MIDDSSYLDVIGFAQHTPWLNGFGIGVTNYSLIVEGLVVSWLLCRARHGDDETVARALWIPIAIVVAYLVDSGLKQLVAEPRPCRALPDVLTILPCDAHTDYSFPSNHAVLAASFAAALVLTSRRWSLLAWIYALLMAASRVYVGAHYPHDVVAGLLVGAAVGYSGVLLLGPLTSSVASVRTRRSARRVKR
jgi:membrane-associated phospholipid phosphatase